MHRKVGNEADEGYPRGPYPGSKEPGSGPAGSSGGEQATDSSSGYVPRPVPRSVPLPWQYGDLRGGVRHA